MELIETSVFTKQVQAALSDEEYRALQFHLLVQPDVGVLIPGSGGLRKIRWRPARTWQARRSSGSLLLEVSYEPDFPAVPLPQECAE